ncbi:hypothetical protein OROMI_009732 [Orobanche minor]
MTPWEWSGIVAVLLTTTAILLLSEIESRLCSCLMLLCAAFSAAGSKAKRARRRAAYSSINATKKASMLLDRRSTFARREDLWGCTLLKRVKGILLFAWPGLACSASNALATLEFVHIYDFVAVHFRKHYWTYNNTTAFSSLGITYDHTLAQSNKGIYTLRVQGVTISIGKLDLHILEDIVEMMKLNPYANFFRSLRELPNLKDYTIVPRADPCLDMRIYRMPTTHQVAAIWNELTNIPIDHPHDICVCWYIRCTGQQTISLDKEHCGESILTQELQI